MPIEDFIIHMYCCVEDIYRQRVKTPLRRRGFQPQLTDSEVITMEIVGEFIGKDQDKSVWRYFHSHWHSWFPRLGSRSTYVKQSANLWDLKGLIQGHLVRQMNALEHAVHLVDGFPMPVCKVTRAYRSHCFKGEAAYGYCAAKDEKLYGFTGRVLVNAKGVICGYTFAAANSDERDMLLEITQGLKGLLIGDKGYIRPSLKEELARQALDLQTPLRKNMQDPRPKAAVKQLMKARRLVETVIGQLTECFHILRRFEHEMSGI
jgi:hypothetical protein